jgi:hypothetical protein
LAIKAQKQGMSSAAVELIDSAAPGFLSAAWDEARSYVACARPVHEQGYFWVIVVLILLQVLSCCCLASCGAVNFVLLTHTTWWRNRHEVDRPEAPPAGLKKSPSLKSIKAVQDDDEELEAARLRARKIR